MLILIVGYACTGKSTLRSLFEERGILAIEASSFIAPLREKCKAIGIGNIYDIYPKSVGAKLIEHRYGAQLDHAVVVGLRTIEEYFYFQERYPVKLMRLQASFSTCYIRSNTRLGRERYDSPESFYENRIAADDALGLSDLLSYAEETLWNENCSQEEFFQHSLEKISPFL